MFYNADFQCQRRGSPINVPHFGPIGVRLVSGQKAALATGGEDGSEVLQEKVELWGEFGGMGPHDFSKWLPSLKLTAKAKWLVGKLLSFWEGIFSGAMLVSGRVITMVNTLQKTSMAMDNHHF